jgi:hypothetical protein
MTHMGPRSCMPPGLQRTAAGTGRAGKSAATCCQLFSRMITWPLWSSRRASTRKARVRLRKRTLSRQALACGRVAWLRRLDPCGRTGLPRRPQPAVAAGGRLGRACCAAGCEPARHASCRAALGPQGWAACRDVSHSCFRRRRSSARCIGPCRSAVKGRSGLPTLANRTVAASPSPNLMPTRSLCFLSPGASFGRAHRWARHRCKDAHGADGPLSRAGRAVHREAVRGEQNMCITRALRRVHQTPARVLSLSGGPESITHRPSLDASRHGCSLPSPSPLPQVPGCF